jgi:tRNA 2-thiouridine synthesizing protein E
MTNPILATVTGQQLIRDHYGNLVEIDPWSHDIARELAREEGLELTSDHLRVLDYLREYVIEHGGSREDAHQILRTLEGRFAQEGGGRWLYTLFPGGPVRQGMKLAGLPEAAHAADPSFGSVS